MSALSAVDGNFVMVGRGRGNHSKKNLPPNSCSVALSVPNRGTYLNVHAHTLHTNLVRTPMPILQAYYINFTSLYINTYSEY